MAMYVENEKMVNAKTAIDQAATTFKNKGTQFIANLTNALSTFEGETKDALMKEKIGTSGEEKEGTLAYFVEGQIPSLLQGLATLLDKNRETIDSSDQKLAEAIRGNGQS